MNPWSIDDFLDDVESGVKSDSSTDSVERRGFRLLEMPERGGGRLQRFVRRVRVYGPFKKGGGDGPLILWIFWRLRRMKIEMIVTTSMNIASAPETNAT